MKGYSTDEFGSEAAQHSTAQSPAVRRLGWIAALVVLVYLAWQWPLAVGAAAVLAGVLLMHELGHYVTARAVGMKVTDFFLGFGPRLWSTRRGETTYGLRALPLGAYVRIIGMSSADVVEPTDERRSFRAQSYPRRLLVVCAGSLMHLCMALVAFGLLHSVVGAPDYGSNRWQVAEVMSTRDGVVLPASAAGVEVGDRVVSVNGVATEDWNDFVSQIQSRPGEQVLLEIERDGVNRSVETTLAANPETGTGLLGVRAEAATLYETAPLPAAIGRSFADLSTSIANSVTGIWMLISNFDDVVDRILSPPGDPSANEDLSTRPLSVFGIVQVGSDASWGWSERFALFALVNVFVGVFNMIPLPPFDGGHAAVATYERWRERGGRARYMIDPRALAPLAIAVVALLTFLGVGLLYLDIANPINL
ncbi:M50 family metallopeptidase [Candidatus Poriferisodalis sp.]|uniref:M50 family metallopeptidase n=1 Tax=Candidatus Poriferisodalis sp. TaxID=3101277 RepID=UPI003B01C88C